MYVSGLYPILGSEHAGAVEIRNELGKALGTELPGTLVFDYPTPALLAGYIASLTPAETPEGIILPHS